ncbi:MAG: 5-(carboxyamino)imidazole ribonucleotide mutase [Gemmatimonadetes bacterium]|nr:5-(carboxyamino)imidazole ribonucleotide mutase [Gemmatimonadota bacterium]
MKPKVLVLVGSKSDSEAMQGCLDNLEKFGIEYEFIVSSAHRAPARTHELAQNARSRGFRVVICGAGMAAALPGFVASLTTLPVIGVPLAGSHLSGADALHAIVQMPPGVPVASMAIGKAGAKNAAIFAAQILGVSHPEIETKIDEFKAELAAG